MIWESIHSNFFYFFLRKIYNKMKTLNVMSLKREAKKKNDIIKK